MRGHSPLLSAGLIGVATLALWWIPGEASANQAQPLNCSASGPTYFPRGDHWAPQNNIVEYRISNQSVKGFASVSTVAGAIQRAMDTWMGVRCGGLSCSDVECDGSGPIPYLRATRGADYPARYSNDEVDIVIQQIGSPPQPWQVDHVISFIPSGWTANVADQDTLALTISTQLKDSGYVLTSDIYFNDEFWKWRVGASGCKSGNCYDVERVALHELGHFLGLHHVTCAGAIMYPSGNAGDETHVLTDNEKEGMCRMYPPTPRDISCGLGDPSPSCKGFGQACKASNECQLPDASSGATAVCAPSDSGPMYQFCTFACDSTSDCPTGYTCGQTIPYFQVGGPFGVVSNIGKICIPGPNFAGSGLVTGGGCSCNTTGSCDADCSCDPDCVGGPGSGGGGNQQVCTACTTGDQCVTGMCVDNLCVNTCIPGANACGPGFECTPTNGVFSVCWPDATNTTCLNAGGSGASLNEVCFLENTQNASDSWHNPCGADLACFYFRPRPQGQVGACVTYCNASDRACAAGLTCCYGLDAEGNCIDTPSQMGQLGGCFNLRREGESCVLAENSICHEGLGCWNFGDASTSACYRECPNGTECTAKSTCNTLSDKQGNPVANLCCDNEIGRASNGTVCAPSSSTDFRDIGALCNVNSDCDSGLCLHYDNTAACSRTCRLGAGNSCPSDSDVNGDGIPDGTFTCRSINGDGHCWPDDGPIEFDVDCTVEGTAPECNSGIQAPGGCCAATGPQARGTALVNLMPWLLLLGWRWRLQRRRRR